MVSPGIAARVEAIDWGEVEGELDAQGCAVIKGLISADESSGEVEFVLIGWQGRTFVGLGSDHTDRKVESYSVTVSKQMCDKPMASVL